MLIVAASAVAMAGLYLAPRVLWPTTRTLRDSRGGAGSSTQAPAHSADGEVAAENGGQPDPSAEVSYDFDGVKKVRTHKGLTIYRDSKYDEYAAYEKITQLEMQADWEALAKLCETEIARAPLWPTAYMCAGEAHMHRNEVSKACGFLTKAVALAAGNKSWQGATVMANQLRCGAK